MNIEDKCVYYTISRVQRVGELERGQDLTGTQGYEVKGCYSCTGNNDCFISGSGITFPVDTFDKLLKYDVISSYFNK